VLDCLNVIVAHLFDTVSYCNTSVWEAHLIIALYLSYLMRLLTEEILFVEWECTVLLQYCSDISEKVCGCLQFTQNNFVLQQQHVKNTIKHIYSLL
jgi:hypothetical protein